MVYRSLKWLFSMAMSNNQMVVFIMIIIDINSVINDSG